MKSRQVPFYLYWLTCDQASFIFWSQVMYWRVEYVQFCINSIGHLGWLSCISNLPRFHKNVNSLELRKYSSENSSPKGSFWCNKRKSEFSDLSWYSPFYRQWLLRWKLVEARSKTWKQSAEHKRDSVQNFLDVGNFERPYHCLSVPSHVWKNAGPFRIRNRHYSLHM